MSYIARGYHHRVRGLGVLVACVGCSFQHGSLTGVTSDGASDGIVVLVPTHLAPADGVAGSAPLSLSGAVTIDTTVPSISVTLPEGDTLDVRPQLGGGPELAVLHVGSLDVASDAVVSIVGTRPLVIVAAGAVNVSGTLDAGGHGATPGAGGSLPAMGDGKGSTGQHETSQLSDSGGGGAGYGTAGASGGAITGGCTVASGAEGSTYGDANLAVLAGGSGGGGSSGGACTPDLGGAGGGALQITAPTISIDGKLLVGGGGGHGGTDCGQSDVNSGPGGGAGGAIYLQATTIVNNGVIAANGGGGGGSSSTGMGSAMPGGDGGASTAQAAGGTGPRAMGGKGGSKDGAPTQGGGSGCGTNAGGGGGAVGRIALVGMVSGTGMTSP